MKKEKNIYTILLVSSLLVLFITSMLSGWVNCSFGAVEINEESIVTDVGTIRGDLYVPDIASTTNKVPGIVVSHGTTSSNESVDSWCIELARRGFVVFAPNLYEHGDSSAANKAYSDTISYTSDGIYDAVEYLTTLPFVDTTRIATTGHSLGGGDSMAVAQYYTDLEREALACGASPEDAHALNKLHAVLTVGYPLEVTMEGMPKYSSAPFTGYNCDLGVILGKADDFQSWMNKDILTNEHGLRWLKTQTQLEAEAIEEGTFYTDSDSGYEFAVWNPNEIHNGNLLSRTTTKYVVDFFDHVLGAPISIASSNQIWVYKELLNMLGMIALFVFVIPCLHFVLQMPIFQCLQHENTFVLPPLLGKERTKYLRSILTGVIINTLTFLPLVLIGTLAFKSPVFPQASTNGFVLWGIACSISTLVAVRRGTGLKYRANAEYYGFKTSKKNFARVFGMALTVAVLTYSLVFLMQYLFGADLKFWTYIIRPFRANKITVMLRYLPLFFVLQFANGIAIRRNNFDNWSDEKRIAFSTSMALLPIVIMLSITYVPILFTGSPTFGSDGSNLILLAAGQSAIKLMSYIIPLGITAFIHVKSQKYTGNIWAGAFINAMLITMISVANCNTMTAF